jgi:hypothetical protein
MLSRDAAGKSGSSRVTSRGRFTASSSVTRISGGITTQQGQSPRLLDRQKRPAVNKDSPSAASQALLSPIDESVSSSLRPPVAKLHFVRRNTYNVASQLTCATACATGTMSIAGAGSTSIAASTMTPTGHPDPSNKGGEGSDDGGDNDDLFITERGGNDDEDDKDDNDDNDINSDDFGFGQHNNMSGADNNGDKIIGELNNYSATDYPLNERISYFMDRLPISSSNRSAVEAVYMVEALTIVHSSKTMKKARCHTKGPGSLQRPG